MRSLAWEVNSWPQRWCPDRVECLPQGQHALSERGEGMIEKDARSKPDGNTTVG